MALVEELDRPGENRFGSCGGCHIEVCAWMIASAAPRYVVRDANIGRAIVITFRGRVMKV